MFGDVTFAQTPFAALGGNTYNYAVSETAAAAAVSDVETTLGGLVEEVSTGTDTVFNSNNRLLATNSETAVASSTQAARIDALAAIAEIAAGTAAQTARSSVRAAQAETATASDAPTARTNVLAAIAELAAALATPSATKVIAVAVSETASGTASQSVQVAFVGTVAEAANALASTNAVATVNGRPDGIQLYVLIGNALVWGSIDDNQNPNWQNIDDTQSPGWTNLPS